MAHSLPRTRTAKAHLDKRLKIFEQHCDNLLLFLADRTVELDNYKVEEKI